VLIAGTGPVTDRLRVRDIAKVAFTSEDRVRNAIRNFTAGGFGSLYPEYKGGRPPKFTLGQRREIKKTPRLSPLK
jgi:transposase